VDVAVKQFVAEEGTAQIPAEIPVVEEEAE
jgi:hypothetical protein